MMAFSMHCDNKGCMQLQEPVLDTKTDKVMCSECGKSITNVTVFAKTAMKSLGQIKRDDGQKKAFSLECPNCHKKDQPVLKKVGKDTEVFCKYCQKSFDHLPGPYKQVLIQTLKSK